MTTNPKPLLLIQHTQWDRPAALGKALEQARIAVCVLRPDQGEPFPALGGLSGIVSLGGSMSANDEAGHPWITNELRFLSEALDRGLPTVGICLGAQLIARSLGCSVGRNPRPELGWHELKLSPNGLGDPLACAAGEHPKVYQWHYDRLELPRQASLLASSEACENQIFRVGEKAYGFQFHPEADCELIHQWIRAEGSEQEIETAFDRYGAESVQPAADQLAQARHAEQASLRLSAAIARFFAEQLRVAG